MARRKGRTSSRIRPAWCSTTFAVRTAKKRRRHAWRRRSKKEGDYKEEWGRAEVYTVGQFVDLFRDEFQRDGNTISIRSTAWREGKDKAKRPKPARAKEEALGSAAQKVHPTPGSAVFVTVYALSLPGCLYAITWPSLSRHA